MKTVTDISGFVFGNLTVIKRVVKNPKRVHWECKCGCGNIAIVDGGKLKSGHTKSCGCYVKIFRKTHGESTNYLHTKEYSAWAAMIKRCNNKTDPGYKDYGGRGIKVCERWLVYENFLQDVGRAPSSKHSIDRFPNNDGDYELPNFRWATPAQQNRNHRRNRYLEYDGKRMVLKDWSTELGVACSTISNRLKNGQSFVEIYNLFINRKNLA